MVKLLLATKGVDADFKDTNKVTPLLLAAQNGHERVVKLLVDAQGVDPGSRDSGGRTPLSLAAQNGHKEVTRLLLARDGIDADSKDSHGVTPLLLAAHEGHEAVVQLLLAREDVDPNCMDDNGRTALWCAAANGHDAVIKLLLMAEAINPDPKDFAGRTPLSIAAEYGREEVVKLLLATAGVNPRMEDSEGHPPWHWAADRGNVRKLLETADPGHLHRSLRLPSLQRPITSFVTYEKIPPLDKLVEKLPVAFKQHPRVVPVIEFVKLRHSSTTNSAATADTRIPDLRAFTTTIRSLYHDLPSDSHFAVVDLVRILIQDPRVGDYFAKEENHVTLVILLSPHTETDISSTPYKLLLVSMQLACNLFSAPLYPVQLRNINSQLRETCLGLAVNSLLHSESKLRVVAASFAYNLAAFNHNARFTGKPDLLTDEEQVELAVSLFEAISREDQCIEALHGLLFALGLLMYEAPLDGTLLDLCRVMEVSQTLAAKSKVPSLRKEPLLKEIGEELLGKGL